MPLQLVPMGVHASKEIPPAMHIQHDPLPRIASPLPFVKIRSHLDPLGAQLTAGPTPLPPRSSANPLDAMRAQLRLYSLRTGF